MKNSRGVSSHKIGVFNQFSKNIQVCFGETR